MSRSLAFASVSLVALLAAGSASAQVSLLEITVEAARQGTPDGQMTVVDKAFAPVTVVDQNQIQRSGGSLGDVLMNEPGITGTGYAPGAASRPIIRGLDNTRVRMQENGTSTGDVSELGEDHAVPVDPLAAQSVEIIRGPAALRYGSQAIGGVVNVTNNRIPMPSTKEGVSGQVTTGYGTGNSAFDGAAMVDVRKGNVAVHAESFGRSAQSYAIPGGVQANTFSSTSGFAFGSSVFFDQGYVGAAVTQFNALYGIPGTSGAAARTRIDMVQTRVQSKGEYRPESGIFAVLRYWAGGSFYRHNEQDGSNGAFINSATFRNTEFDVRAEGELRPIDTALGQWSNMIGTQVGLQRIGTEGDANGLLPPADTRSIAAYYFGELGLTSATRLQWAGRLESATVSGTASAFPADYLGASGNPTSYDLSRSFTPGSASLGLRHDLPYGLVASITGQYTERAPRAAELFARGTHDATRTFEIGNPNLSKESARSAEIGLRKAKGPFRFDATAYFAAYTGFIYKQLTGQMCDDDFASCGTGNTVQQVVYQQADANFYGTELKAQYDVLEQFDGTIGVEGQYDFVRAQLVSGPNLPRIPPHRLGGGVYYRSQNWFARLFLLHAFDQPLIGANDTATPGYNMLNADLSYKTKIKAAGRDDMDLIVGLSGKNLLDDRVINAVSFNKTEVLMPGRTVRLYATVKF